MQPHAHAREIAREELKRGLEEGSIILVDVREAHEYDAGHIPGAVLAPLSSFDPGELPRQSGKRLVLSCQSGKRSLMALERSRDAGRDDVAGHFAPGFAGWRGAGEAIAFD